MKLTPNWLKQSVGFDWSPEELADRPPMFAVAIATEWRKKVAHVVSRGLGALFETSPGGAAEISPWATTDSLSPLRGFIRLLRNTHGSRHGLTSAATLWLTACCGPIPKSHLRTRAGRETVCLFDNGACIFRGVDSLDLARRSGAPLEAMNDDMERTVDTMRARRGYARAFQEPPLRPPPRHRFLLLNSRTRTRKSPATEGWLFTAYWRIGRF